MRAGAERASDGGAMTKQLPRSLPSAAARSGLEVCLNAAHAPMEGQSHAYASTRRQ